MDKLVTVFTYVYICFAEVLVYERMADCDYFRGFDEYSGGF